MLASKQASGQECSNVRCCLAYLRFVPLFDDVKEEMRASRHELILLHFCLSMKVDDLIICMLYKENNIVIFINLIF